MHVDPGLARKTLATVRMANGIGALLVPKFLLRRLGTEPALDHSGIYPFRMFGVRTVLIGADLLLLNGAELRRARQFAVLIHASDSISAAIAWRQGDLPKRAAMVATLISVTNTGLALIALGE